MFIIYPSIPKCLIHVRHSRTSHDEILGWKSPLVDQHIVRVRVSGNEDMCPKAQCLRETGLQERFLKQGSQIDDRHRVSVRSG